MRPSLGKFSASIWACVGLVSFVLAQDSSLVDLASQLPSCVLQCFTADLLGPDPSCAVTNMTCLCTSRQLRDDVGQCVLANCTLADSLQSAKAQTSVCHPVSTNSQTDIIVIFASMLALSCLFVAVRLYVRLFVQTEQSVGLCADDWIIISATLLWTGYSAAVIFGAVPAGLGADEWELSVAGVEALAIHAWAGQFIYCIANGMVKLAFIFLYLRIFPEKSVRYLLLSTAAVVSAYIIAFTLVSVALCQPIEYFWKQWTDPDLEGTCVDYTLPARIYSIIGIALDLFIIGIPLLQLRKLKMNWKRKLSVALMFSVGIFITVVSCVRLVDISSFNVTSALSTSWAYAMMWTTVEVSVGIMCTCFPACRIFLMHFFPKLRDSTLAGFSTTGGTYGNNKAGGTAGSKLSRTMHSSKESRQTQKDQGARFHGAEEDQMELRPYTETFHADDIKSIEPHESLDIEPERMHHAHVRNDSQSQGGRFCV